MPNITPSLKIKYNIPFLFWIILLSNCYAQEKTVQVELGPTNISLGRAFTITVTLENNEERPTVIFPELKGFQKRDKSVSQVTKTNGATSAFTQIIVQNYFALAEGKFSVPESVIKIDKTEYRTRAATVLVGQVPTSTDPGALPDLAALEIDETANELADVKEDAFLALTTSKKKVYVRQGFTLKLSFYVADNNTVGMEFYELDAQLQAILKKITPAQCWEENFDMKEVLQLPATINGRRFTEYRIFQATFFPLSVRKIVLPAVGLDMKLFRIGNNAKAAERKTFYTKVLSVAVDLLPVHPERDQVSVGAFELIEKMDKKNITTGQSARLDFKISGNGNVATLTMPEIPNNLFFDVYPPEVQQTIRRGNNQVSGDKMYSYYIVPKQNGVYPLGDYFKWIYFDPVRNQYDTLRSALKLGVGGENIEEQTIEGHEVGSIYANIEKIDSSKQGINIQEMIKRVANVLLVAMLIGMIFIFVKR